MSRLPFGPSMVAMAPAAIMAGTESRRRRGVAEIAAHGGATLNLGRADQFEGLDDARPNRLELLVFAQFRAGHRGADSEAAVFPR